MREAIALYDKLMAYKAGKGGKGSKPVGGGVPKGTKRYLEDASEGVFLLLVCRVLPHCFPVRRASGAFRSAGARR